MEWHSTGRIWLITTPCVCVKQYFKRFFVFLQKCYNVNLIWTIIESQLQRCEPGRIRLKLKGGASRIPKTPIQLGVCLLGKETEDEKHVVLSCEKNEIERLELFQKISGRHEYFMNSTSDEKYYYMFINSDPYILSCLGKFLFRSSVKLNSHPNFPTSFSVSRNNMR